MWRRDFITLLGGAAMAWPLAVRAEADRVRRIGVLMSFAESDSEAQSWIKVLVQQLNERGWIEGHTARIEFRWATTEAKRMQASRELIELNPDVFVAGGTPAASVLSKAGISAPIVFVQVADPVELRFVTSLAHPGGNLTGFSMFELTIGGKWLQILKQVAPLLSRVAVILDSGNPSWSAYLHSVENATSMLGVPLNSVDAGAAVGIERAIDEFAHQTYGGLIVLPSPATLTKRELIVELAARYRLPAIYPFRFFTDAGGLISYGVDLLDMYRRAAAYVDRVLQGEKVADLPVQAPTKYEMVINLKTANALGVTIPLPLLARADEVIE